MICPRRVGCFGAGEDEAVVPVQQFGEVDLEDVLDAVRELLRLELDPGRRLDLASGERDILKPGHALERLQRRDIWPLLEQREVRLDDPCFEPLPSVSHQPLGSFLTRFRLSSHHIDSKAVWPSGLSSRTRASRTRAGGACAVRTNPRQRCALSLVPQTDAHPRCRDRRR